MELPYGLSLDHGHFEYWKCVDSQLEKEVDFEFGSFLGRPVWIVPVDFGALAATANNRWEPILFPEKDVSHNCGKGVKTWIVTEFEHESCLFVPCFTLILMVDQLVDFVSHEVIVAVFGDLLSMNILRRWRRSRWQPKRESR